MIIISAPIYNLAGTIVLQEDRSTADLRTVARRVSRTATLDGGAVLDDAGFSDGDRTLTFGLRQPTAALYAALEEFAELYSRVIIATQDGVFYGGIERVYQRGGQVRLSLLVESKLSA